MLRVEQEYPGDVVGAVESFWLANDRATDFEFAGSTDLFDSVVYLTPVRAVEQLWPALDAAVSHSRLLDPAILGADHVDTARRVRDTIARAREVMYDAEFYRRLAHQAFHLAARRLEEFTTTKLKSLPHPERLLVDRARRLEAFFSQRFYVAEPFTKQPGTHVSLADTIAGCKATLDGHRDGDDPQSLRYIAGLKE